MKHVEIEYSDNDGNIYTVRGPKTKEINFRTVLSELGYHVMKTTYYDCEFESSIKIEYNK